MEFLIGLFSLVVTWKIFVKIGRRGWEGLIPIYSAYVLFEELQGKGWKVFLLLIPFYNIYLAFKLYFDLARRFNRGVGFGVGLVLLYPIFGAILAFGRDPYQGFDHNQTYMRYTNESNGASSFTQPARSAGSAYDMETYISQELERLQDLRDSGVFSEEEYQKFKADLLNRTR